MATGPYRFTTRRKLSTNDGQISWGSGGWSDDIEQSEGVVVDSNSNRVLPDIPEVTEGLISHYRFDGDATDSVRTDDGSLNSGFTQYESGVVSDGVVLDGSGELVSGVYDDHPEFSASVWVRPDSSDANAMSTRETRSGKWKRNGFTLGEDGSGQFYLQIFADSDWRVIKSNSYALGEWHHLVGVASRSDGDARFYVDGTEVGSVSYSNRAVGPHPFYIGGTINAPQWVGGLDDARFYDRRLSESEISDLHSLGSP